MKQIELGKKVQFNYYTEHGRLIASGTLRGTDGVMVKIDVDPKFTSLPDKVTIVKSLVYEQESEDLNITKI